MLAPTCTVPATVQVSAGKPADVPVTVQTVASGSGSTVAHGNFPAGAIPMAWTVFLFASVFLLIGSRKRWSTLAAPVLLLTFISWAGCGGGSGSSGTSANTYSVTVTATSGAATSKTTLTVIVE
jgi:hypothetical protein